MVKTSYDFFLTNIFSLFLTKATIIEYYLIYLSSVRISVLNSIVNVTKRLNKVKILDLYVVYQYFIQG